MKGLDVPKLSVVMCNYNHAQYLPEAIDAIMSQSYNDFELIIIEDCSKDGSRELLERYSKTDSRIKVLHNEVNIGVLGSANKGLGQAKGEFIYFAAADDRVCQGLFHKAISLLEKYASAGVCSGLIYLIDDIGENKGWIQTPIISKAECYLPPLLVNKKLGSVGSWFTGQTAFYRRKCFDEMGLNYIAELRHRSDHYINYLIAAKYGACFFPEVKASYRILSTGYAETIFSNEVISRETLLLLIKLLRDEKNKSFLNESTINKIENRALHEVEVRLINNLKLQNRELLRRLGQIQGAKFDFTKITTLNILNIISEIYFWLLKCYIFFKRINGELGWLINRYRQIRFNADFKKKISL
jgi:glycosyltransferase involved in cell wall biosynthesis